MKYRIDITDTAKADLSNIASYIAGQAKSKEIALNFLDEFIACCNQIIDFPESGAYPKDRVLKSMGYRYLVHKDYLVFYVLDNVQTIAHIVAVFNAKKDYNRVLKSL